MENISASTYLWISAVCWTILLIIFIVDMSLISTYIIPITLVFATAGYTLGCGFGKLKNEGKI